MKMQMSKYNYYKERLKEFTFPYACLDLEMFYHKGLKKLERAGSKQIRFAYKSIRCRQVMEMIFEYHDQYQGIMTYHGNEVLFLAQNGFDDILMAYPVVDPKILEKMVEWVQKGRQICLMTDSEEQFDRIEEVGRNQNVIGPP